MLKKHGVYSHLCKNQTRTYNVTVLQIKEDLNCTAQDKMLNLAFTIGSFCVGLSAVIWGFLIDKWGLRPVRLLLNAFITTGAVLLSITSSEMPYFLFPALILMCLAAVPLRIANLQVANLFPKQRSTIITLYSGAFSASAAVFIIMKYVFDAGCRWEWVCAILVIASGFMFPATLFIFPCKRIPEYGEERKLLFKGISEISTIYPEYFGKFSVLPSSPNNIRKLSNETVQDTSRDWTLSTDSTNSSEISENSSTNTTSDDPALKDSLLSFSFFIHLYWFSWLLMATINYAGSLNLWLERITNNVKNAGWYTQVYGLAQLFALILAPVGGMLMDLRTNRAIKEDDPDLRKLKVYQSGFWPLLLTTVNQGAIQICRFFNTVNAVYISVVFITILRSLLVAVATAYLRIRFPATHFNKLLGIMSTIAGMFTLLQYPLFIWESKSSEDALSFNIFNAGMLVLCFIHPFLLLITPLQKYFIKKEVT
ncbi:solute carrier family 43 member 3-like isoform X1 [Centruroides sculpturatus]|uniref:solute carrier family 43 member 3-like isoform X1 n=2 Tax=Centruroides sculpturatus TaxID=218467 RepID=UPI000C6DE75C|nr:solute carrier family 43 member 3-like isoform X1 [Centruroides sculpturatus]